MSGQKLRILFFDIETAPLLAHIWRPSDQWVPYNRLEHDSFMLTWAAKWEDRKKIHTGVLTGDEARRQDDERIVVELADLLRDADYAVAHNVDRFDVPMLNNRLLAKRLEPIGPVQTIDTLKLARKNFRLAYNNLNYLGEFLGLGSKIDTDFDLWRRAYHGDEKALAEMRRYNRRDVELLEDVFEAMRPYVSNLKRTVIADEWDQHACPNCGSVDLQRRGYQYTQAAAYKKYRCNDCGRYSRARTSDRNRMLALRPL